MRTEKCLICRNYTEQPTDQRTGREWMNATGWCDLPRLHTKRRRIDKDNWCDQYVEGNVPETMTDLMVSPEAIAEVEGPDESFGSETSKGFEHWKLSIQDAITDLKLILNELDVLVNTPYEDLE